MSIVLEKYQLENVLRSNLKSIIFPLLPNEVKQYARNFLRKELNKKRKLKYHEKMEYYKKVFQ